MSFSSFPFRKIAWIFGIIFAVLGFIALWFWTIDKVFFSSVSETSTPLPVTTQPEGAQIVSFGALSEEAPSSPYPILLREKRVFTEFTDQDIRKGQVAWQDPEDMGDLRWMSKEVYTGTYDNSVDGGYSSGVRYVKVGTVTEGKYTGAELIVVASWLYVGSYPHSSDSPSVTHYLRQTDGTIVSLPYSDVQNGPEIAPVYEYAPPEKGSSEDILTLHVPNEQVDYDTRIEELAWYPKELQGASERGILVPAEYAGKAFFSPLGLRPVFVHPQLGQVWMMDATQDLKSAQVELNAYQALDYTKKKKNGQFGRIKKYYSPVVFGGFYLKRPDGLMRAYRLKLDIFDTFDRAGVLQGTWDNGERNTKEYEEYPSGCGGGAYAYDRTGSVNVARDLIASGKTDQGDTLYEYRPSHPDLKLYYKNIYQATATTSAEMLSDDHEQSDWKNFLEKHPIVLWMDPYERLLAFYNTETFPLAECGKPVVYLYPKQVSDVSVRVFPSEGVRISDPEYGDGWNVVAHPNGMLINKADGKEYSSLFWEGGSDVLYERPEQGFVTSREHLKSFFDEKLAELGLSSRESADFQAFWIPKMMEQPKPYYFVTFLGRETIDQLAPLLIEPKPDTVIRVMMDYQGLDVWKDVPGFTIRTPKRQGFTAVEWGGRLP